MYKYTYTADLPPQTRIEDYFARIFDILGGNENRAVELALLRSSHELKSVTTFTMGTAHTRCYHIGYTSIGVKITEPRTIRHKELSLEVQVASLDDVEAKGIIENLKNLIGNLKKS